MLGGRGFWCGEQRGNQNNLFYVRKAGVGSTAPLDAGLDFSGWQMHLQRTGRDFLFVQTCSTPRRCTTFARIDSEVRARRSGNASDSNDSSSSSSSC